MRLENQTNIKNTKKQKKKYEEKRQKRYKGESEDKAKKLQEMYTMLLQDKKIKEYLDLEVKFNVMIADVNKIIAESIKDVL